MSGAVLVTGPSPVTCAPSAVGSIRRGTLTTQLLSAYYRAETLLAVESTGDSDRQAAAYARHLVPGYWRQVQGRLAEMAKEWEGVSQ